MVEERFVTRAGIAVKAVQSVIPTDSALHPVLGSINTAQGALFSSGFDYPGRHSRWDIGFIHPALEVIGRGNQFTLAALNPQGRALLDVIEPAITGASYLASLERSAETITGVIAAPAKFFTEEERSRQPSLFSVLRALTGLFGSDAEIAQSFGLYGAFGYDLVMNFEDIKQRHARDPRPKDCHLFLPLEVIVVDRKREVATKTVYSVATPSGESASFPAGGREFAPVEGSGTHDVQADHAPGEFAEKVAKVIEGTAAGDYFEVVLSQTFSTRFDDTPTALFQRLAAINPSPYMFLLNFGTEQLIGASPELFVRVTGRRYETCPIAGTVPRGATALEDADRVQQLIGSKKDESELTMCTDVDRNDMARVCVPGSVQVIGRRQLEFYSHLIHTVDHLEGYLRDEFDAIDAFQTHMWACTVTGAPKPAALQEIENLEKSPRGWYSGAIGFLSFSGNINTGITLRTAHIAGGRANLRAGATLLFGSDPAMEEQETRTKAAAFLAALAGQPGASKQSKPSTPQAAPAVLSQRRNILLIDHRDSFVHNLAAYLRELGQQVVTLRCGFPIEKLDEVAPDLVLLSPGPGTPAEFKVPEMVGLLAERKIPTFGVCLGHQGIGQHFGGTIGRLPIPEHGKASAVTHRGEKLFRDIPAPFEAGRYHSLYIVANTMPACLEITAETYRTDENGNRELIPMAVQHRTLPIAGVQFHPESLMTLKSRVGHSLLKNAIEQLTQ